MHHETSLHHLLRIMLLVIESSIYQNVAFASDRICIHGMLMNNSWRFTHVMWTVNSHEAHASMCRVKWQPLTPFLFCPFLLLWKMTWNSVPVSRSQWIHCSFLLQVCCSCAGILRRVNSCQDSGDRRSDLLLFVATQPLDFASMLPANELSREGLD